METKTIKELAYERMRNATDRLELFVPEKLDVFYPTNKPYWEFYGIECDSSDVVELNTKQDITDFIIGTIEGACDIIDATMKYLVKQYHVDLNVHAEAINSGRESSKVHDVELYIKEGITSFLGHRTYVEFYIEDYLGDEYETEAEASAHMYGFLEGLKPICKQRLQLYLTNK